MILPALALFLLPDAAATVQRMESFLAQNPSFTVKFKLDSGPGGAAEGTLAESRPSRIAYTIAFADTTYRLVNTPDGVIESATAPKLYSEYPSDGVIAPPYASFSIADWRMAMPVPLFFNRLNEFFPRQLKMTPEDSTTINGAPVDVVRFSVRTRRMNYTAHLSIDQRGRLVRYVTEMRSARVKIDFGDYSIGPLRSDAFKLSALPLGFTLSELPGVKTPLRWDHKLPDSMVIDAASGDRNSLASVVGSPGLLAVVDSGWLGSAWGRRALSEMQKTLSEEKAGKLTLLNDEPRKPANPLDALMYDPSGAALDALSIPASPTFFLINKNGLIERIWCGYHPENEEFMAELKDAIEKPGESRPEL